MIPQVFAASVPFLSSALVTSATSLFVSAKQREQNYRLALFNAQARREELEVSRRHRLEEIGVRHALDVAFAAESQARRERWEIVARTYPFFLGPGSLTAGVDKVFPHYDSRPVPIVILEPVIGDNAGLWGRLHAEAKNGLAGLQQQQLLYAIAADRPVSWPHNLDLHEYDIGGRPAIVVTPEVGADRLHISVGGCNLHPNANCDVFAMTPMLTIEFRHAAELQAFSFEQRYDRGLDEMILVPVRRIETGDFNIREPEREYVKLGASAINLLVARLVDHYHLANRFGYTPRYETLLRQFEAREGRMTNSALTSSQVAPSICETVVADVPYYRLTQIRDLIKTAAPEGAVAAIARSLAWYGGAGHPEDVPAVVRLLQSRPPTPDEEGAALREAQKLLTGLPNDTPGRTALLNAVSTAITQLTEARESAARRTGPALKWY